MNQRQKYIDKVLSGKTKYAQRTKLKLLDEKIHGVTPQIFASFALVLNEKHKWNPDDIDELFEKAFDVDMDSNLIYIRFDKDDFDVPFMTKKEQLKEWLQEQLKEK